MSFRNRPVLDRKHRPRWQDELRSQQLIVAGFALAIAVAIGIFAAAAWSAYFDANLRQVALVGGIPIERSDLSKRADVIQSELIATGNDLNGQLGGSRDQILQQQIQAINDTLNNLASVASDSVVTGTLLTERAAGYGLTVGEAELADEVERRRTNPERKQLSMIMVFPRAADDAPEGAEPTEEDWKAAKQKVQGILDEIEAGAEFAALAAERSDDQSKQRNGLLGWIEATDGLFGEYFETAGDAPVGEVLGPLRNELGWYLLRVDAQQGAGRDEVLDDLLAQVGVTDAEYRAYVRGELLRTAYRDYFASTIVARYQPQREVAQIFLNDDQGQPIPKIRIRHVLVQPIPGADSQAEATDEQWAAALAKVEELRVEAAKPDADWAELATQSDDPGSRDRGGDLGWHDPVSLGTTFVPEFAAAATDLRIGELSEPVRTDFGYHIIQVTDRRTSAAQLADRLVTELRADPDRFAEVARQQSEDTTTADDGGELGWVIHYQFEADRDTAIFDLTDPNQISDPVITDAGIYIFKLLGTSEARFVPESQRNQVGTSGFARWLAELQDRAGVWLDPELAPASAVG